MERSPHECVQHDTTTAKNVADAGSGKEMLLWFLGPLILIIVLLAFIFIFLREDQAEATRQTASPVASISESDGIAAESAVLLLR